MVALVLVFPKLVGAHVEKVDAGMVEIKLESSGYDGYLRPPVD
jgi:hypothetical protein